MSKSGEQLAEEAAEAREKAKPWVENLTRLGYLADGVVYVIIGYMALRAASGARNPDVEREEALRRILLEPLGQVLLVVIAAGLLGYAAGHFFMATRSRAKEEKQGVQAWVNRGAHLLNAFFHVSLALAAAQLVAGSRRGGGRGPEDWTALVMQQPLGRWAVGLVGAGMIVLAIYELYKAYTAKFRDALALSAMNNNERAWVTYAGRIGYTARGIIYGIISIFLIQAANQYDPQKAGGLGDALVALSSQTYGPWLLGAVALGLIFFGVYVIFLGRYRQFKF